MFNLRRFRLSYYLATHVPTDIVAVYCFGNVKLPRMSGREHTGWWRSCIVIKELHSAQTGPGQRIGRLMSKLIFVVDDEPSIARTLALIFCAKGYSAYSFEFPHQALKQLEQFTPDLIVTDVAMPGMDGVELADAIRARHPRCKVILMSGNAAILHGKRIGARYPLLQKPVPVHDMLAAVEDILSEGEQGLKAASSA